MKSELRLKYDKLEISLRTSLEDNEGKYKVDKILTKELIENKKGTYYLINLFNPEKEKVFLFEAGKFTIESSEKDFIDSMNEFMGDVYKTLEINKTLQLYTKGSADFSGNNTFKSTISDYYLKDLNFSIINYLPQVSHSETLFSNSTAVMKIFKSISNKELPNLRGKFIQYKISENYLDVPKPIILEGNVEGNVGEKFRNTSVIMYIDWNLKIEKN